jgi:hypothetical protein
MTRALAALLLLLILPASAGADQTAIVNVTIVDVAAARTIPGMTVILTDNRITAVGPSQTVIVPPGARVIDGRGEFLCPGFWDMHVHLGNATAAALPVFIAFGVTGVRDMGSPRYEVNHALSIEALSGARVGPRIVAGGPILDGSGTDSNRVIIRTPADARRVVDSLARIHVDFIKVHEHMSRELYFAIAAEARRLSVPFVGHVPADDTSFLVSGIEASNAGQASLEHMFGVPFPADTAFTDLYSTLRANHTWVDPTLVTMWTSSHACDTTVSLSEDITYTSPGLRAFWVSQVPKCPSPSIRIREFVFNSRMKGIAPLRAAGIPLLAGTDVGFPYVIPGKSLHKELALLVEAGLTPAEALATATSNPARFLGLDNELGAIKPGWLADLVLLRADPLRDISAVSRIETVIANGRVFSRRVLDQLLRDASGSPPHG